MHLTVAGALRPLQAMLKVIVVLLALLAIVLTTSVGAARPARAATTSPLRAVLIVGPSGDSANNKDRSDLVASHAAAHGMEVTKLYTPHATWSAVVNAVQGANFVSYMGHGNGWPSPYGPYQEDTKDGMGLNYSDGSSTVKYYGAKWIRNYWHLAPHAVVALNHLCYSAGNGEPGMAIPTWDVARQRVDNYANGFLYAGAEAVFAYGVGYVEQLLDMMFTDNTMDGIFKTVGAFRLANYGFVGWDDRYFASQRMPGFTNHLDPENDQGYRRALTGKMDMTTADWRSGAGGTTGGGSTAPKPVVTAPRASLVANTTSKLNSTVRLDWDASTSPNVVKYELQYSRDSGSWVNVSLATPAALSGQPSIPSGSYYRFRLRATDSAGTVGDWVVSASRKLGRAQESATALVYGGTWSGQLYLAGASGDYVKRGTLAGQKVSWTFSALQVGYVTTLGPNRGVAEVWLDGTKVATVDLYAATLTPARMVWATGTTNATHVVEVRATGTKNASSTSTAVDVDAFVIWK